MDTTEQFSIVPGARPDAIITGPLDMLMEHVPQSTAIVAAEERLARVTQEADTKSASLAHVLKTVTDSLRHIADRVTRITGRVDIAVAQKAERARQDKEAAEARRVEELLAALPDPDDPDAALLSEPDDGDLEAPKHPASKEHYDPEHRADIPTGIVPEKLSKKTPPPIGNYFEPDIKDLTNLQKPLQQSTAIL